MLRLYWGFLWSVMCLVIYCLLLEQYAVMTRLRKQGHTGIDWESLNTMKSEKIQPGVEVLPNKSDSLMYRCVKSTNYSNENIHYNKPISKTILTNFSSIFSEDYVPSLYSTMTIDSSVIHICQIVAKPWHALETEMFVRSVILHARRSDVFFHFVATEGAEEALPKIFDTITHAFVHIRYEIVEMPHLTDYLNVKFENKVKFGHPWAGIYSTGKLFMYDLLPHVNTCIIADSDTLFGADPAFLWNEANQHLQPPVNIAATWAAKHEHFNSGVMVHNLENMRNTRFSQYISMKGCQVIQDDGNITYQCEHEQHLLLQIMISHRELFYLMSTSWNLDNCSSFRDFKFDSFCDEVTGYFFGVAHLCCFPPELKYAYEKGSFYMRQTGLINYYRYLKNLNFSNTGEKNVFRVSG